MNLKQALIIMNELIKNDDIKTINSFKKILDELLNTNIDCFYFFEPVDNTMEYWSNIEYELTDINSMGYPVGYTIDIIYDILSTKYSKNELNVLYFNNKSLLLELFIIAYDYFSLKDLNYLIEFLKDNIDTNIAFKYFINSLNSNIKDSDKVNFIMSVL